MVWKSPLSSTGLSSTTRWKSPISSKSLVSTTRMIRKAWAGNRGRRGGIQFQALKIIAFHRGAKADEIASLLLVPTRYAEELCETLAKDGEIIRLVGGGYTLKENVTEEILEFVKLQKVIYADEACKQFMMSPEEVTSVCEALVESGQFTKTNQGGYFLKKDKGLALSEIRRLNKETTEDEVEKHLGVPASYAGLLCDTLAEEYTILRTPKGKFIPAEEGETRLLRMLRDYGSAPADTLTSKMKIGPAYAELLCRNLVRKGYLKKVNEEAFALVERKVE